jgi:hypothetical protein
MAETRIKSNAARLNFHDLVKNARDGTFTGISRYDDPVAAWAVSDEWVQAAIACGADATDALRRGATETRRHFKIVLNDAEKGISTIVGHWNDPPALWFVPDAWYQRAKACLGEQTSEEKQP